MKNWIIKNKLYFVGALVGAVAGFLYWKYVGYLTGTCAITSRPINSTLYFAFFEAFYLVHSRNRQNKHKHINNNF